MFSLTGLQDLESSISYQLDSNGSKPHESRDTPKWLEVFGTCVSRLLEQTENNKVNYALLGQRLAVTTISFIDGIRLIPMVGGKPVGRPIQKSGALVDTTIYVNNVPSSRLANLVPTIIGEHLSCPTLQAAAAYCFERSEDLIVDYFQSNFEMLPLSNSRAQTGVQGLANEKPRSIDSLKDPALSENTIFNESDSTSGISDQMNDLSFAGVGDCSTGTGQTDFGSDLSSQHASGSSSGTGNAQNSPGIAPNNVQTVSGLGEEQSAVAVDAISSSQYSLVKAYAKSIGMIELHEGHFQNSTGMKLVRQRAEMFPWALISLQGDEIKRFLVRTSPIAASPLELDSIAFGMLEKLPQTHSLLLPEVDGSVGELAGESVQSMISSGLIKVYPASYRLIMT